MSAGIDRRSFVKGAALGFAAPGLLAALGACGPDADLDAQLTTFHDDPVAAAVIGSAYLKLTPDEEDRNLLVERLAGDDLEEWERLARRDPAALRERVLARHLEDFQRDRVVRLNGWVLSKTEARLAALAKW